MPVHDWTLVEAGIFHDFHTVWIGTIRTALNDGLLPQGYYALAEQHAGDSIADVLTLHSAPIERTMLPEPPATGGTAVAEAPPRVRHRQTVGLASLRARRRTVAVRHVSGHRLVALIEIVSPANKDRATHLASFASKAIEALEIGVHLLIIDLFPPGPQDPGGIHAVIRERIEPSGEIYEPPPEEPLTLAAYAAADPTEAYLEHLAVGADMPDMPLFVRPDRYINLPLQPTYNDSYRGVPSIWREVLERR